MNASPTRAWWPANAEDARKLALQLRLDSASIQLFEFMIIAAAHQEWDIFCAAMAALCELTPRGVRNMIENQKFDAGWSFLYGATGMPPELMPLFIEILKVARKFTPENGTAASWAQRVAIVQQALASPAIRGLKLPAELRAALLT